MTPQRTLDSSGIVSARRDSGTAAPCGRLRRIHRRRTLIISGGVACNSGRGRGASRTFPTPSTFPPGLSTDNAAMIAAAAFPKLARREFADLSVAANPNLTLA